MRASRSSGGARNIALDPRSLSRQSAKPTGSGPLAAPARV